MEFSIANLQPKERASFALRALYEAAGCRKYHMGRFEEYGLYQENRSFLSSEQVITFTDLDGRLLALKPDVTLSIAKTAQPTPGETLCYYYHENVYRPSAESHTFKEISQMGLEMLGAVGEAQVQQAVCLAARSLDALGAEWVLEVSHMGYLFGLFDALGVPDAARAKLLEKLREKNAHELRAAAGAAGLADAADTLCSVLNLCGSYADTLAKAAALCRNDAMRAAVAELEALAVPLEKAGGLFAIPGGAPSVSCWFLDQSSLESLGLTDVPATYADLMTLISTYLTDFASDSDVALADNPGGMADSLFQQLFWAQLARCEASGVLPTFTDADFVAALRQYIALRPALVDYETRWLAERSSSLGDLGDTGGIVTILSVSSSQPSLLHLNTSLTPSKTDEVPLLLSFSEGGALLIPMTYSVLAVNRRSAYPDDAASLLSYLLDNQPYDAKLALLPDYAALQPNPAYTEAAQKILDDEALYTQYRATLSPLEQKQAEDILADARAALHQIPPDVYSVAEIATYHARLNHAHLLESSFWVSGDQHVSTLRQRLLDGECTVETFVQELTRIVQMMTLENGVSS